MFLNLEKGREHRISMGAQEGMESIIYLTFVVPLTSSREADLQCKSANFNLQGYHIQEKKRRGEI